MAVYTAAHTCMHRKVCAYMTIMLNSRPCFGYSQNSLIKNVSFCIGFQNGFSDMYGVGLKLIYFFWHCNSNVYGTQHAAQAGLSARITSLEKAEGSLSELLPLLISRDADQQGKKIW